jgi:Tol biopolymer transport system component
MLKIRLLLVALSLCPLLAPGAGQRAQTGASLFAEGVVSTVDHESNGSFSPDGRAFYFTKYDRAGQSFSAVVYTELRGGRWAEPRVAPFSGRHPDSHPSVSPDGRRLYFSSSRPVAGQARRDFDIWYAERDGAGRWGEARRVEGEVNTDANELAPAVTRDGTLYFWSVRPGGKGGADIYRARLVEGKYAAPENLGDAVNSKANETDFYVAPDAGLIIFASNRPGGEGQSDLYVSRRGADGSWGEPRNLGRAVNSAASEGAPALSPDGRRLLFASTRGPGDDLSRRVTYRELRAMLRSTLNGFGNFYTADAKVVDSRQ